MGGIVAVEKLHGKPAVRPRSRARSKTLTLVINIIKETRQCKAQLHSNC